jgi:hypothetical protein
MSRSELADDVRMIEHFESLGDNCEFGFVQKAFGIEEGNFFRWARINDMQYVIDLLDARFEGIFEYENMRPRDLTMVEDLRFPIHYHTDVHSRKVGDEWVTDRSEAEKREIFAREGEKAKYMARKFLVTIASQSKIYVAKQNSTLPDPIAKKLLWSLRALGDASLLYVVAADSAHPPGTVERLKPNLYKGYIDRFAEYHAADQISLDVWKRIIERTWQLQQARQSSIVSKLSTALRAFTGKAAHLI